MKKILARVLAMTLVLMTVFGLMASASANTISYSGSKAPRFGKSVSFYVTTKDSTNNKVKAQFAKGNLYISGHYGESWSCRGSYEVIVYFKNDAGNWQWESQYTCYNTSSKTITLKKANENYKIVIRAKDAMVVWNSYVKNDIVTPSADCAADANSYSVLWKMNPPEVKLSTVSGGGTGSISK